MLLLNGYLWALLLCGFTALLIEFRADAREDRMTLPAWNLGWLDFGLGLWILMVAVFAVQNLAWYLLGVGGGVAEAGPVRALVSGIAFHGVALLLILGALRRPDFSLHMKLNPLSLRFIGLVRPILLFFFSGNVLVLVVSKLWETVLHLLADHGLAPAMPPQSLVTVFLENTFGLTSFALIVLAVIVAPVTEELLFRAGIYRFFKGRFSSRSALIISSFLFALMHLNVLSFLPLFLLGMLLCRSYERTGNLFVPIGFHALFNANNVFLLMLQSKVESLLNGANLGLLSRLLG